LVGDLPEISPKTRRAWRAWLQKHHATASGVWLLFAKKHSGLSSPSYNDAVEEALCFGWIDGLTNAIDDKRYKQLFTPRKPRSAWAQSNKARVARMIEQGLMTPAGRAAIETAKRNGHWETLDHVEALTVPRELQRAINADAFASKHWPTFTDSQRKQFLYWLASAKREETRAKRIEQIVAWAAKKTTPSKAYDERRATTRRTTENTKRPKATK